MSTYVDGPVELHYDDEGDGYPVFTLAPGGMRSANALWNDLPWSPRKVLTGEHRVIGMDQRNAGSSRAPVSGSDGWDTYTRDQLAVLDHLGVDQCHLVGMCIGGPFIMGLLAAAPERFRSAVMFQPVGIESDDNRAALAAMFDAWSEAIADDHPEADDADWASFRSNMWDGDFVLTVTRDQVPAISTPLLVLMGDDMYHPQATSREIADLAPSATLVERWKDDDVVPDTIETVRDFIAGHTPG